MGSLVEGDAAGFVRVGVTSGVLLGFVDVSRRDLQCKPQTG